ncbi:MAG: ribosomal RNA small subunit methyltransferase A [Candidatus Kerfeldbacteria bacterium]|nr:ribosomal RNA small subunit methyltransferase A [Candidatus Kerfeldbacteria bacterium]
MTLLEQTQHVAKKYGIRPRRERGQNFLVDETVLTKMIQAADLTHQETVVEVGGGLGTLTRALADHAKEVVVVEIDTLAIHALQDVQKAHPNVRVIHEDILKLEVANVIEGAYTIVASLPYNITSLFLRTILEHQRPPKQMVLVIQREVARRITAKPGDMSILAVAVQFFADVEIMDNVPPEAFWPRPEVHSSIVRIVPYADILARRSEAKPLFRVVRAGFSSPRKQLRNTIKSAFHLENQDVEAILTQASIDPRTRAERLSLENWKTLQHILAESGIL